MAETPPSFMQGVCRSPQSDRLVISNLVCGEGVANPYGGDLLVTPSGADGSVSIAQGGAYIAGEDVTDQGMYSVFNDAPETVLLAANASGNPRIDLIIARVYDSTYGALSDQWTLEATTGTANASAALTSAGLAFAPAQPTDSLLLAYVLVPNGFGAGSTVSGANILDVRNSYTACGGTPSLRVYRNSALNVTSAYAAVLFDTVSYNTFGGTTFASGTTYNPSTGEFTAPSPGLYRVGWNLGITSGSTTDWLETVILVNGSGANQYSTHLPVSGISGNNAGSVIVPITTAGHKIAVQARANATRALTVNTSNTWFSVTKVSA